MPSPVDNVLKIIYHQKMVAYLFFLAAANTEIDLDSVVKTN